MLKGFIGDIGGGKTASMILHAFIEHLRTGKRIVSNMKNLKFDYDYISYDDFLIMVESKEPLADCILLIDEIHIWMDSRTSAKKSNRVISYFALQTRKVSVDLYYTTQYLIQVDVRLRNLTTHLIECYTQINKENGLKYTLNVIRIRKINDVITKKYVFQTRNVYNLYDTNEVISI